MLLHNLSVEDGWTNESLATVHAIGSNYITIRKNKRCNNQCQASHSIHLPVQLLSMSMSSSACLPFSDPQGTEFGLG